MAMSDLQEIKAYLNRLFVCRGDETSWQQHLQAVRELGQPDLFTSFLRLILATPALLHEIAARSYIHENKFDKIVLISSSDPDYKLRLHIWWPSSESPFTESIHNHQWVLSSVVLAGALHFAGVCPR